MKKYYFLVEKILASTLVKALTKHPIIIMVVLVGIAVFWSFPSYDVALLTDEMQFNWDAIFRQAKEPFTNHNHLYRHGSHEEKLAFRFVPALILKALGIKTLVPSLIFQFFTLVFFYVGLTLTFMKIFRDKVKVLFYSIPICLVIAGHVYTSDYRGIFDTLALAFLVMSLLFKEKPYVIIFLLLSYFTDERAIIASSSLILITLIENHEYHSFKSWLTGVFKGQNKYVLFSWVIYLGVRYGLWFYAGLETGSGDMNLFFDQIDRTLYTIYIGLEGFILLLILMLVFFIRQRAFSFSVLVIASYAVICVVAQSVIDINRSMSYAILFIIFLLIAFDKFSLKNKVYPVIFAVIVINAVYDDLMISTPLFFNYTE